MPPNEVLYDMAVNAISVLFSDTSVSKEETRKNLEHLIGEIQIMLEAL